MKFKDPDLAIPFEMDGSTALFRTRTPAENEFRDHFKKLMAILPTRN